MRVKQTMLAAIAVSAVVVAGATPALAATGSEGAGQANARADAIGDVQAALQRDLGLSAERAKQHGTLQAKAIELDAALQASLGAAFAGSSYDARTGKLLVTVSDARQLDEVRAAGAEARLVKYSKAQLEAIRGALDVAAGKVKGSGAPDRQASGARQALVAGMTSWYVDVESNAVHVTVRPGQAKAAAKALARYGDAVVIEESDLAPIPTVNAIDVPVPAAKFMDAPSPAAKFMDGGDLINGGSCSAGFNLRNKATGQGYLLTAGRCVKAGSTLSGPDGTAFGTVLESRLPTADDALAINQSNGFWIQGPWVDTNPSNGPIITLQSYTDAPVGTTVCKSGRATGWTCGKITAKDETISYPQGAIFGLTRFDACVEMGDYGAPVVSVKNGVYSAEGLVFGAQLINGRCHSTVGQHNVSWYFPVADSLAYYGPKYGVTVW
jgi:streptogrisin C